MKRVCDDLVDPADHLALDEALLLEAEEGRSGEALRIWEFASDTVVLGRSSKVDVEIDREFCDSRGIPILRRSSGGATVVGGRGCLMYSLVLGFEQNREFKKIDVAHEHVMTRVLEAVHRQVPDVAHQGICDLTWQNRKCSGNSLRISRGHLLYHGTILYDFDLELIGRCLKTAPRQPDYRGGRDHESFVNNLPIDPSRLAADLCHAFGVIEQTDASAFESRIHQLRSQRYDVPDWHFRH